MQEESFEVQYTQEGERLDKVLSEIYPDFSRSFFQKLIKNKQIQVNGAVQKASYPVHTEDSYVSPFRMLSKRPLNRKTFRWTFCMKTMMF